MKWVLQEENNFPKRFFVSADELESYFSDVTDLLFDATETPTQHPENEQEQKDVYSKKTSEYKKKINLNH